MHRGSARSHDGHLHPVCVRVGVCPHPGVDTDPYIPMTKITSLTTDELRALASVSLLPAAKAAEVQAELVRRQALPSISGSTPPDGDPRFYEAHPEHDATHDDLVTCSVCEGDFCNDCNECVTHACYLRMEDDTDDSDDSDSDDDSEDA